MGQHRQLPIRQINFQAIIRKTLHQFNREVRQSLLGASVVTIAQHLNIIDHHCHVNRANLLRQTLPRTELIVQEIQNR